MVREGVRQGSKTGPIGGAASQAQPHSASSTPPILPAATLRPRFAMTATHPPALAAEQVVGPHHVQGRAGCPIDYARLVETFGVSLLTRAMLARLNRLLGPDRPLHPFLGRRIVFAHRDFDQILDCIQHNRPFYIYTGRGPSSAALHLGHLCPFIFTKWLQDVFDVPVVIQLTDDEKYLRADRVAPDAAGTDGPGGPPTIVPLADFQHYADQNLKDILSVGFDPHKTFIFRDSAFIG